MVKFKFMRVTLKGSNIVQEFKILRGISWRQLKDEGRIMSLPWLKQFSLPFAHSILQYWALVKHVVWLRFDLKQKACYNFIEGDDVK